jgi:AmiR/NasT family two-component response regulator
MPTRIVIAEDEPLVALALQAIVESQGYEVVGIAGTGREALTLARDKAPDVILMDIQMPEMDGVQATRSLMEQCPQCVVVISGNGQARMIESAEAAGAMDYVLKPVLPNQVKAVVDAARKRFDRFMGIRRATGDPAEALDTWVQVKRAADVLVEKSGLAEAEAYDQLEREAARTGDSLRTVAERVITNSN